MIDELLDRIDKGDNFASLIQLLGGQLDAVTFSMIRPYIRKAAMANAYSTSNG